MMQALLLATAIMTGATAAQNFAGSAAYPQTFTDEFNPLKYTGSLGPYSQRTGNGISTDAPAGCEVEQVVLFARHGASYPDPAAVKAQKKVLETIRKAAPKNGFVGSLAFMNRYEYFVKSDGLANVEITSGPYAGLAGSFKFGAEFAGKYGNLWNEETLPIFSDGVERDLDSARSFGQGFLGFNYSKSAAVNVYESFDNCKTNKWTQCHVKTNSTSGVPTNTFRYPAFQTAAIRLNQENALQLTADDVFTLFELASSEIAAKGSSPWVDVFTTEEWIAFEYSYDVYYDCFYGSQSPRSKAIGSQFVNATAELLSNGPEEGLPVALVFGQDAELLSILSNLNLAMPSDELDPEAIQFDGGFRISDVAPMGARLVIERLNCKASGLSEDSNLVSLTNSTKPFWNSTSGTPGTNYSAAYPTDTDKLPHYNGSNHNQVKRLVKRDNAKESTFVRFILNDAVVPWKQCYDGPGFTCSLDNFLTFAKEAVSDGDYEKVCGTEPSPLTFLSQYNSTTTLNYDTEAVPYQGVQQ